MISFEQVVTVLLRDTRYFRQRIRWRTWGGNKVLIVGHKPALKIYENDGVLMVAPLRAGRGAGYKLKTLADLPLALESVLAMVEGESSLSRYG